MREEGGRWYEKEGAPEGGLKRDGPPLAAHQGSLAQVLHGQLAEYIQ